jgi:hypothetical protein
MAVHVWQKRIVSTARMPLKWLITCLYFLYFHLLSLSFLFVATGTASCLAHHPVARAKKKLPAPWRAS